MRGNFRLLLLWPVIALLISGIGWSVLNAHLDNERQRVESVALDQAAALARNYADHLTRTAQFVDQILLHVKYEWMLSDGRLRLEHARDTGLFPAESLFNVMIVDRKGANLTSSRPARMHPGIADREYFQALKKSSSDALQIGMPVLGRAGGDIVIPFSRRLTDPDGKFDGAVVGAVQTEYFTLNYDEITLGRYGFLGVVGGQGGILAARIGPTVHTAKNPALAALPGFDAAAGSVLFDGAQYFSDKRSRYVGWDAADEFPLIGLVGLDQQEVLAPYHANAAALIRYALWATLALAAFTLIAMAFSLRLGWRKRQLEITQVTYRMATEGGSEGFYIARAITGADGAISDFAIIDSNRRGAEFIRQRRENLIGKRISLLYEDADPERLIGMMRDAMESGEYEDDVQVRPNSPFTPQWMHLKMLRSDGDLAITVRDISDVKAHVDELERRSNIDPLTDLPNRHWAQTYLPKAVRHAQDNDALLALLFIDLDGFKGVNDRMGHAAGDELLRNAAARLKEAVRPHDHVVRLGGDEFVVIIEQIEHKEDAAHVAARINLAFRQSFRLSQGVHTVGTSIGISLFPADGTDAETLLRHADVAMYSVKESGKGDFHFYDQRFYDALRVRINQELELRQSIEQDQFVIHYQPRLDLATGVTSSMEALVRWDHPTQGLISPLEFIPLAEESTLILGIGELVIDKVCAQLAQWGTTGQSLVPVSINVSPRQFNEVNVPKLLSSALARHRIAASLVEIELTESLMMAESPDVSSALTAIRRMGIKLLVDDFGTGYSSLSQLQRLDFDVLKVDRAFTSEIERTERGKVFFKAIITMAHALGMRVVAEGVENEKQLDILRTLHCDEIQGFYISAPLPPGDTQPVLTQGSLPAK
ncbi:bifunctional diguanylate cyclase/phosphodiesterase [Noviherbaspirillum cavernae]|uniref:bifunctional diguanylate cyclase/phosphodiesterase n=1 Tax=Noviherbaspirillum cavernae TaxID=2320862 RepID=UPI00131485D3|nr:EAL domain-containing protein [Noviherbaspirillum cavernae]